MFDKTLPVLPLKSVAKIFSFFSDKDLAQASQANRTWNSAIHLFKTGLLGEEYSVSKGVPLIHACEQDDYEAAKLLIDRGADVNEFNCEGSNALSSACVLSSFPLVKLLIDNGADPNICDKKGVYPLALACLWEKELDLIRYVLERTNKEFVDCTDGYDSPLQLVCERDENFELAKLLIQYGADPAKLEFNLIVWLRNALAERGEEGLDKALVLRLMELADEKKMDFLNRDMGFN